MPRTLALVLTLVFITWLFRRDFRQKPNVSGAIWIPTIWLFIIASAPVSEWLDIVGLPAFGGHSVEEGSPLDASVFFTLIASGVYVIHRRRIDLFGLARDNRWLLVFLFYCFLAVFWSDYPLSSFKRWMKVMGHPIMVLVIFSEPDPQATLATMMKRCAYVLFPVSILWIKYYPALGRKSDEWGATANAGVAGGKNELGAICLFFGLFFLWHIGQILRTRGKISRRQELVPTVGILLLIGYCLLKSHSSTSLISLLLGALVMFSLRLGFVNKRKIGVYTVMAVSVLLLAQLLFDVYGKVVDLSGHESTIDGRGHLWEVLLETNRHPVLGTGFESYWLGERREEIANLISWHPTQAHNGYLETYLSLGGVGLVILILLTGVTFWKCRQDVLYNFEWGCFTMAYFVAVVARNWTEAGFKGLSIAYFCFFIAMLNYRQLRSATILRIRDNSKELQIAEVHRGSSQPAGALA